MSNGVQISTSVTIINSLLGFQAISLSNMSTSAATVITAGSKCEIKSAFFNFPTDLTPNASSWTAIATANTAYLVLTPAGSAGTQTVSASWTQTAPVWSDSAQGWYTSTGSIVRHIGGVHKSGATSYDDKFLLDNSQRRGSPALHVNTSLTVTHTVMLTKVVEIGAWNMDTNVSNNVVHGLGTAWKNIRKISAIVRDDADTFRIRLNRVSQSTDQVDGTIDAVTSTVVNLDRKGGGLFDTSTYSSIAISRGWVTFEYEVE